MPALPDNDPLQTTLDSLRSDVERTPLADSLSVRRRGEARSRHQAVAGALVIAALVAGAFGVADLRGNEQHRGIPAASDTDCARPRVRCSRPTRCPTRSSGASSATGRSSATGDGTLTPPANSCLDAAVPSIQPAATAEFRAGPAGGPNAGLRESIYQFPNATAATAAQGDVGDSLQACATSHRSDQAQQSGLLDLVGVQGGKLFDRSYTGPSQGARAVDLVAYGTNGNKLVVLGLVSPGIQDVAPTDGMATSLSLALYGAPPSETPGPLVTDVPSRALMQKGDLTRKTDVGTARFQPGQRRRDPQPCLLATDDA